MVNVLLIDNFDSFTFNLYQFLGEIADSVTVVRNDSVPFADIEDKKFSHIVISPGPGHPADPVYFDQCAQVLEKYHGKLPILGICLGHQGLGCAFGSEVVSANTIMHGKTSMIDHSGQGVFSGVPQAIEVMRYHSLVIKPETLSDDFVLDATAEDGSIMAIHHKTEPTFGIQFHPESFATEYGKDMLANFLRS